MTVADFATQAVICQALGKAFPHDPIIAEENANLLQQPESSHFLTQVTQQVATVIPDATEENIINWINRGNGEIASRYWTLDPIDGTKGFIRQAQYTIALALIEEGEIKLGIMACPALPFAWQQPHTAQGVVFLAIKNQGSKMLSLDSNKSQLLQVNQGKEKTQLQIIESIESRHSDRDRQKILAHNLGISIAPLAMDSMAKYGAVARGEADVYVRIPLPSAATRKENIWDHAAGAIVVTEAGGKVTDIDGRPLDFSQGVKLGNNHGIAVSNGEFHDEIIEQIQSH